ncbi:MAG: UDP-N-acetylmuramate dehydrogenase, partial [Candidatus Omnitrophica bacterium]|nr:UDP-N-acetylmuramate dehydrogenase [Candidatus Omnitrophota bacterium]
MHNQNLDALFFTPLDPEENPAFQNGDECDGESEQKKRSRPLGRGLTGFTSLAGSVSWNESMREHTTLRVGGPADVLIIPADVHDVARVFETAATHRLPVTVIGNGSNLLVSDEGIEGIVIKISGTFADITVCDGALSVGAGCSLSRLIDEARRHSLTGLEPLTGIPGTVGGALVMNAGVQEAAIGDAVETVTVMDTGGHVTELDSCKCQFGYRSSIFQKEAWIILNARLRLRRGRMEDIDERIGRHREARRRRQPLELYSAGS